MLPLRSCPTVRALSPFPAHEGAGKLAVIHALNPGNAKRVFEIVDAALASNPPPATWPHFCGTCHATLGDMYVSLLYFIYFIFNI